ncbi:adenosylcobinamide-GDP ribazoletransferase [Sphingomonas sp. JC676]|uniref:adenosylcobinamide-GDP ribazoletransferase n=1 Tax=Sphingomonas sp. JC676 TaxID=2768065 RepID=UPI001657C0F6|nr:adenosylcobinamide-GDP ribazoletransferase [Sphingomonas sp. JC676]MBC9031343.1 adenosylcobinamide-GDP ribazoletransferase [Sphingomonas sp. JC676]
MKGLILALQFLTRLPMPRVRADEADFARSMRWFPAGGLVIGIIIAGSAWACARLDPWTGALTGLVAWVAVTGALHLDGLSDLADASGAAHKDRDRMLTVMADPHVGSFGVVAIALQLIAKLVLLHELVEAKLFLPLILVPFAARIGPLVWTRWLPPLHNGLAARFASVVRILDIGGWLALLAASAFLAPAILAAPLLIAVWWLWLRRRIGGVTGDCHGAGIELVETGLLLALLVASHF